MDSQWIVKLVADGMVVPVVLIGVFVLLKYVPREEKYQTYARILLAGLTAYAAAKLIGALWQPNELRPFELLGVSAGASFLNNPGFPSDHVLFMMSITLAVWFGARQKEWALACLVLTVLVGIGRVVALVHTPLDVVGGFVIACMGIVWYIPRKEMKSRR